MYLGKTNYQGLKFLVLTLIFRVSPKFLLTFLDKVSQILVLYNLDKNICFVYLYYLPLFENISRHTGLFFHWSINMQ